MKLLRALLLMVSIHCTFLTGQSSRFTPIQGEYLGQKPPGLTPEVFAPGIISTDAMEHSAPAFSPDSGLVLWSRVSAGSYPNGFLLEMRKAGGRWTEPNPPSFADSNHDDIYAHFSYDGKKVYFSSRRPLPSGERARTSREGMRIWNVARRNGGWGTPVPIDISVSAGHEYAHSVSAQGALYFSSDCPGSIGSLDIYCSRLVQGQYQAPEHLGNGINTEDYEDGPFIAADESYLIFESSRPDSVNGSIDLFICFRQSDGSWSPPVGMGPKINTEYSERFARVSPDGKYLFFGRNPKGSRDFDIYWVDARVIDEVKQRAVRQPRRPASPGGTGALRPYLLALEVADREASVRWYAENLGFVVSDQSESPDSLVRATFLERDGFRLEIVERNDGITIQDRWPDVDPNRVRGFKKIAFQVEGIENWAARLQERNVKFMSDVRQSNLVNGRWFMVRDADGNNVEFVEIVR